MCQIQVESDHYLTAQWPINPRKKRFRSSEVHVFWGLVVHRFEENIYKN